MVRLARTVTVPSRVLIQHLAPSLAGTEERELSCCLLWQDSPTALSCSTSPSMNPGNIYEEEEKRWSYKEDGEEALQKAKGIPALLRVFPP